MLRRRMTGSGSVTIARAPAEIEALLRHPAVLKKLIPKASHVALVAPDIYEVVLSFLLGPLRGQYHIAAELHKISPLNFALRGSSHGRFGGGTAKAMIALYPETEQTTQIGWAYNGMINGPIALVAGVIAKPAAAVFIERFFKALANIEN